MDGPSVRGFHHRMVCEIDIWYAAHDLIRRYGDHAIDRAAERCFQGGDHASCEAWLEILRVIFELEHYARLRLGGGFDRHDAGEQVTRNEP